LNTSKHYTKSDKMQRIMDRFTVQRIMDNLLQPVIAGAGLSFGLLFLMAVANGMSSLLFNQTITNAVTGRIGGGE